MAKQFKPMLAATCEDVTKIQFPVLASPKLDGIRALVINGVIVSRNLKPIRNKHIQSILGTPEYNGLDGELIVGESNDPMVFRNTSSGVMSEDGEPDFKFYVFDDFTYDANYSGRFTSLKNMELFDPVVLLEHNRINNVEELNAYEATCLEHGYEGIMVRSFEGSYKYGRSTVKEGGLLKVKQFKQDEALVVGFKERMKNLNEAVVNALGHTERSTHKDNKVGRGDLGALQVKQFDGDKFIDFEVGSGFTDEERKEIWNNREKYRNRYITFKYFEVGGYDAPRFPTFVGFRDEADMGE